MLRPTQHLVHKSYETSLFPENQLQNRIEKLEFIASENERRNRLLREL